MNCELAQERIVTAAYGELADEQMHELERHVSACRSARRSGSRCWRSKCLPMRILSRSRIRISSARARLRLDEALDTLPPKRWYERLGERILNNFASLQAAPVAALLLLVAGAGAGVLGGYEYAQSRRGPCRQRPRPPLPPAHRCYPAAPLPELANVAGISGIVRHPNCEIVDVSYNQLVPRQIEGSLDDPVIRQLLMLASQNARPRRASATTP